MKRSIASLVMAVFLALAIGAVSQDKSPLALSSSIPLPELHDGDFDHFVVDVAGNRLFATAEENSKVLVFDLEDEQVSPLH